MRAAARRPGAAESYARRWGIPRGTDHYEDVIDDPDIDAVYVSIAAADHARWTIAALTAGKHVLCEKPIAVDAAQATDIQQTARRTGRVVMEGFHYRFHPLFRHLTGLVASERFGRLEAIDSTVSGARAYDPRSILQAAKRGGGSLLHNGVYAVHWTRTLFAAEPSALRATQRLNPSGADAYTDAELLFPGGRSARVTSSFERDAPVSATLRFEGAEVVATGVIGPHHGHSLRTSPRGAPGEVLTVAGRSSFDYQLREFVRRLSTERGAGSLDDDIVRNMRVIDAIRHAACTDHVWLRFEDDRPSSSPSD